MSQKITTKSLWTSAEIMKGMWNGVGRAWTRWLVCLLDYKRTLSSPGGSIIPLDTPCTRFLFSHLISLTKMQKSPSSNDSLAFAAREGKLNTILDLLLKQTSQQTPHSTGELLCNITSWKHAGTILWVLHIEHKSCTAGNTAKTSTNVHDTCTGNKTRVQKKAPLIHMTGSTSPQHSLPWDLPDLWSVASSWFACEQVSVVDQRGCVKTSFRNIHDSAGSHMLEDRLQ